MTDALPPPPDDPPAAAPPPGGAGGSSRAYDRVPPHSLEAEVSVLGASLLSKNAASDVVEVLRPEDFYRNAHRLVYEGILDLHRDGGAIDTVTLTEWLARRGRLDEVGGAAAVYDLTVAVPTAANAAYYAGIVRERALLRRLIDVGTEVVKLGYEASDDAVTVVDRAESLVYEVAQTGSVSDYARLGDLLTDSFEQIEKLADQRSEVTGLATGYNDFDRLTAGLQPQNLVIIAARPAMGKCLTGDTLVLDGGTGERRQLADIYRDGIGGLQVVACDDHGGLGPAPVSDVVDNGVQPVFRLLTASGRSIRATANHPFLGREGWTELRDLLPGCEVAVAEPRPRNLRGPRVSDPSGAMPPGRAAAGVLVLPEVDTSPIRPLAEVLWDEVVAIEPAGQERVYDLTVPGHHNFVANDIVVHNSSLALGLAHYVTAKVSRPALMFSLEMSKIEIVNRLLSAEARIDSSKLRTGRLDDADWLKLGDALGTLSEAPLFIDDTPSITLNEIRAKCRRLKQKHGLDLVIVDYLQLMQSHRRVDNRQQEVAEISRGLKMLAKEMDAPVIALSQLSRQPESRTDKRPMLADLRESGCLTRQTRLFRADTGATVTFGELLDQGLRDVPVWAAAPDGKLVEGRLTHAYPSGRKPVYRVTLRSGLRVEATANHPFRTFDGWAALGDLRVGARVAAARRLPEPSDPQPMDPDELVLLAHLIGEGTTVARQPIQYTSADAANLEAVEKAAWNRFGITARCDRDGRSRSTTQLYLPAPHHLTHGRRNPIAAWLDDLGLWDRRSDDKHLPAQVFALPQDQVRRFLAELWATDGCLHARHEGKSGPPVSLYYASSSPQLAQDVALLLRRVGLLASIREVKASPDRPGYQVWIDGTEQQRRFLVDVGVAGSRAASIPQALAALEGPRSSPNVDVLRARAVDDLVWDEIAAIELVGERDVYDATVAELHNFVAEGLVLHNSIEQDADIVGFIYRDEVYDEDSPDKGIAELIVAKHRNGATGVVKLAFLNHLTTFANLARNTGGGGPQGPQGGGQSNGGGPPPPTPV